jgi:hypothetical protein
MPGMATGKIGHCPKGWLQLAKPFTGDALRAGLVQAMGPGGEEAVVAGRVNEVAGI